MSDLKPIQTAPRDGTRILALWPDIDPYRENDFPVWTTTWWHVNRGGIGAWENPWERAGDNVDGPTHWMPAPEPPK